MNHDDDYIADGYHSRASLDTAYIRREAYRARVQAHTQRQTRDRAKPNDDGEFSHYAAAQMGLLASDD